MKMEKLAEPALNAVEADIIRFIPEKYKNTYRHWMTDIRDWCISRQLWWGHRIPAWYLPDGSFVVAMDETEALELAKERMPEHDFSDNHKSPVLLLQALCNRKQFFLALLHLWFSEQ